ncbi:MAG: hypothetical protein AAF694_07080 [Bacteroidota bacterium]
MASLDLIAQKVRTAEIGMWMPHFRGIIGPAVVALREEVDLFNPPYLQGLLELAFIKLSPHVRDVFGGMEVEMNLSYRFFHRY